MRKGLLLITVSALIACMALPALAYDQTGRFGLSYRFGFHTVAKDPWNLRFMHGGEAKWVLHKNWAVGLIGTYARTDGAGLDVSNPSKPKFVELDENSLRLVNYILEAGPTFNITPLDRVNAFLQVGAGIGWWGVRDRSGEVVRVNDLNGKPYKLEDQQFTVMFGGGAEYFLIDNFAIGAALRYHLFTNILSGYRNNDSRKGQDESDALDLPSGLFEGGVFVTAYFGKCKDDDKDGVCNEDDECPDTPRGCKVDERGCPIDSDGDGVCDGLDKCPDTPRCAVVDIHGCPIDSDGDGVPDGCDKCPDTPPDCEVDKDGCPIDSDGDGVPDCRDKCPDTPSCCIVDADGCPLDSDNDGVCDGCDECPGTPEGFAVDERGCPKDVAESQQELSLVGVEGFVVNTWTLTDAFRRTLDRVADQLKVFAHVRIEVQGHTDISGTREWNLELSQNRASAVRDYFISKGIAADRLVAKGYGPDRPKYDNSTAAGRSQNRRVELVRLN